MQMEAGRRIVKATANSECGGQSLCRPEICRRCWLAERRAQQLLRGAAGDAAHALRVPRLLTRLVQDLRSRAHLKVGCG